jgi:MYXO-CTERM domain-containing protein
MKNRPLTVLSLALFATLAACSSSGGTMDAEGEATKTVHEPVIKGMPSTSAQDAVVLLIHYDPNAQGVASCTGTLLAPNLVLTARHCVADTDESAACDSTGTPLAGGAVRANHPANTMYVFTGKDRPKFNNGTPQWAGQGAKILDDGGKNLCNHDIAMVLLKEPIANAQIAQIRLDGEVENGESITSVGWGVTDTTPSPQQRQQRSGVKILATGPDKALRVAPNEFEVGESICSGDSGGPALVDPTNAIVGVVSRGGNMTQPDQSDPAATCIDGQNLYTKVAPFKDFILSGYALAEAEPWLEGQPDPRLLKPGNACDDGSQCRSALCLADPTAQGATTCAQACTADSECSDGNKCTTEGDAMVCRPPPPPKTVTKNGCAYSPASSSSGSGVLVALGALVTAALRRRRKV